MTKHKNKTSNIYLVYKWYIANWVIIYRRPPSKGTRNSYWNTTTFYGKKHCDLETSKRYLIEYSITEGSVIMLHICIHTICRYILVFSSSTVVVFIMCSCHRNMSFWFKPSYRMHCTLLWTSLNSKNKVMRLSHPVNSIAPQPYWDLIKIKHQNPVENTAHHVTFFGIEHIFQRNLQQNRFFIFVVWKTHQSPESFLFWVEMLLELCINKLKLNTPTNFQFIDWFVFLYVA